MRRGCYGKPSERSEYNYWSVVMAGDETPFSAVPMLCAFYKKLPSEVMAMTLPHYNMAVYAMNRWNAETREP